MEDTTDPSDWSFLPLKDLDALLRCPICFEYFRTTVLIPACSHNYCSLCIRRYLATKQECPTCSRSTTEADLKCNRLFDEVVECFTKNRKQFMTLLKSGPMTTPLKENGVPPTNVQESSASFAEVRKTLERSKVASVNCNGAMPALRQRSEGSSAGAVLPALKQRSEVVATPTLKGSAGSPVVPSPSTGQDFNTSAAAGSKRMKLSRARAAAVTEEAPQRSKSSEGKAPVGHPLTDNTNLHHVPEPPDLPFTLADLESQGEGSAIPPLAVRETTPLTKETTPTRGKPAVSKSLSLVENVGREGKGRVADTSRMSSSSSVYFSEMLIVPAEVEHKTKAAAPVKIAGPVVAGVMNKEGGASGGKTTSEAGKEVVECPVCSTKMQQQFINLHLDRCLNGSLALPPSSTTTPTPAPALTHQGVTYERKSSLPPLPSYVFNVMNPKELRKKAKDWGLPTYGSRNALIARLKEFKLRYKAQMDSLDPKTKGEIAADVMCAEQERDMARKQGNSLNSSFAQVSRRNTSASEIEVERKNYEHSHKDQFAHLLAITRDSVKEKGGPKEGQRSSDGHSSKKDYSSKSTEGRGSKERRGLEGQSSSEGPSSSARYGSKHGLGSGGQSPSQSSREGRSSRHAHGSEGQSSSKVSGSKERHGLEDQTPKKMKAEKASRLNSSHHTHATPTSNGTDWYRVIRIDPVDRGQKSTCRRLQEGFDEVLAAESPERVTGGVAEDEGSQDISIPESPPLVPSPSLLRSSTRRKRPRPSYYDSSPSPLPSDIEAFTVEAARTRSKGQSTVDHTPQRASKRLRRN